MSDEQRYTPDLSGVESAIKIAKSIDDKRRRKSDQHMKDVFIESNAIVETLRGQGFDRAVIEQTLETLGYDAGVIEYSLTEPMEKEEGQPYNVKEIRDANSEESSDQQDSIPTQENHEETSDE